MGFDGFTVRAMTHELKNKTVGCRVEKVLQPSKDEIYLLLHGDNGKLKLAAALSFLTEELTAARWKYLDKPMTLDLFQWTAHRLSKEIEHSDRNLTRLEALLTPVGLTELFGLLL